MADKEKRIVRNELLCFMQQKSAVLKFDDLVSIVVGYYSSDEIKGAVTSVHNYVDTRIPAYKGADKDRKLVSEVLKLVLNPDVQLPSYVAADIAHLPAVDVEHLDMSALLKEMSLLRAEIRCIGTLRAELEQVTSSLMELRTQQSAAETEISLLRAEVRCIGSLRAELEQVKSSLMELRAQQSAAEKVGTSVCFALEGEGSIGPSNGQVKAVNKSFSAKAQDLQQSGMKPYVPKKQPVIGSSTKSSVKSVETVRTVDIFVSRLHPSTAASELVDCVNTVKGDLKVTDIQCKRLQSKYEHLYTSYHVSVTVGSVCFKSAIDIFTSAEAWPMGVFVKRYFRPRHGSHESS